MGKPRPRMPAVASGMPRGQHAGVRTLLLALALALPLAAAEGWSGVIEITEALGGRKPAATEAEELDRLAASTEDRLRMLRTELRTLPPAVARTLRADIGFYQTELERTVLARGGQPFPLAVTRYQVAPGRVLAEFDRGKLLVDRNRNTALLMLDGETREVAPAPPPKPADDDLGEGAPVLGVATRRRAALFGGKAHECLVAPDLPNVYALAAVDEGGADSRASDFTAELARQTGLPMTVAFDQGRILLMLSVTRLEAKPIPDAVFTPWK